MIKKEVTITKGIVKLNKAVTKKFLVDQFETIEEAIEHLGSYKVLEFINYTHELNQRARIYRTM
jgi:hypothetical protein